MESYRTGSAIVSPQKRQMVANGQSTKLVQVAESMNVIDGVKDAAGSTCIVGLTYGPMRDKEGLVGSYWGSERNLQWKGELNSVVETDGSAAFTVKDTTYDLEKLFEGNAAARYVAVVKDSTEMRLYGWIGGVSVSSNVYTFSVYSEAALSTQNWFQGGATAFDATKKTIFELYRYTSAVTLGSTDTFTEEVMYPHNPEGFVINDADILKGLSNGQYCIDYENSRFLGRKANADNTETITYKIQAPASIGATAALTPGIVTKSTTVAGGAVAISATALVVKEVTFQAPFANTDYVFIGDSNLDAASPTTGIALIPGASYTTYNVDLSAIYMDVLVNDEDIVAMYTQ